MNETTENFWQVWSNLETWQPPAVFWRLYYNEEGHPLFYTQQDCPGNYIDVTPEQYQQASMQVRVINNRLVEINKPVFKKLMPSTTGTPCEPADVAIVVDVNQPHQCWRTKTNETN